MSGIRIAAVGAHVVQAACSLAAVLTLTFMLLEHLPSDAARASLGLRQNALDLQAKREELGLDAPWPTRLLTFAERALHGDFGNSLVTGEAVSGELALRLSHSAILMFLSSTLAMLIATLLLWLTQRSEHRGHFDLLLAPVAAIPPVALGGTLLLLAALSPQLARLINSESPISRHVLAAAILSPYPTALMYRVSRFSIGKARRSTSYLAARALGLHPAYVWRIFILRSLAVDAVALLTNLIGYYLTALFAVEVMFTIRGAALWMVSSARRFDYPVVVGITLSFASIYVAVNLIARLWLLWLDPRSRHG